MKRDRILEAAINCAPAWVRTEHILALLSVTDQGLLWIIENEPSFPRAFKIDGEPYWKHYEIKIWALNKKGEKRSFEPVVVQPTADPTTIPELLAGLSVKDYWPGSGPCVYFLIDSGIVVYVGQTKRLGYRIHTHVESSKIFDRVLYLPVDAKELDATEERYIKIFRPKYNIAGNGG